MSAFRLPILSRYSLPSKKLLINYINHTNNRDLNQDQINFGTPILLDAAGKSQVPVSFHESTGWEQSNKLLTYFRTEFSRIPGCERLSIYSNHTTQQELLDDVFAQYGLLLELQYVTIDQVSWDEDGVIDYTVTFVDHLIFFGSFALQVRPAMEFLGTSIGQMMDLRAFYMDGNRNRIPIDLYTPNGELLLNAEIVPDRTFRSALELALYSVLTNTPINTPIPAAGVMETLTGDEWLCVDNTAPFNLKGSVVVYNGLRTEQYQVESPAYSYVMVIEIGELCSNLQGLITIGYQYSQPFATGNLVNNPAAPMPIVAPR